MGDILAEVKNVSADTIKHCFQKCNLKDVTVNPPKEHCTDHESVGIFAELSAGEYVFLEKFISFDYKVVFLH